MGASSLSNTTGGKLVGIIGGSGLDKVAGFETTESRVFDTPYGAPSGPFLCGRLNGVSAVFLFRHGSGHRIAPHEVNYRANLWAMHALGVNTVIAINAVGGIAEHLVAGKVVVPDQLIDYTHSRPATFFEGGAGAVVHTEFTHPYDDDLCVALLAAAAQAGVEVADGGVHAVTQGPRFETAAEIRRLEREGADLVGMTGMPEAVLARELALRYACLAVVSNPAAGKCGSEIQLDEIYRILGQSMRRVCDILRLAVPLAAALGLASVGGPDHGG